jgi:peptidoglycan hydrolase FlgJ
LFTARWDSPKNLNEPEGANMQVLAGVNERPLALNKDTALRAKSQELEAAFLAEMLSHAGLGAARDSFGGGIGEEQFASFLRSEQAKAFVSQGGVGLAEHFFRAIANEEQTNA